MSRWYCASLAVLLSTALVGRADQPLKQYTFTEPHMGTRFKVLVYSADKESANRAAKAAFARIAALDGIMSDYRPASELMQLCQKAGGDPVPVSPELFTVLARSQDLARASDGAFDVTIGPVVKLWRRARKSIQLPDPEELAAARKLVGHDKIRLDAARRTVQLTTRGMKLDLGGIAKGYAADEALKVLADHGLKCALVAAGGDIAVGEAPPNSKGWKIGIAPLLDPESQPKHALLLSKAAVSTSGDAEQYVEIEGKRYSHIVDPRTGVGVLGQFSVTVIARHGITTDCLATAVSVLGPEKGLALIAKHRGVAALIVEKRGQKEQTYESPGFQQFLIKPSQK